MTLCDYPVNDPGCDGDDSPIVEEVIGKLEDVKPGTKKTFEVRDRKILVINDAGKLFAINGVCSHYNFSLENGTYAKGRIRCPLHGACFNVRSGDIEDYPGFDSLHSYDVSVRDGDIILKTTEKKLSSDRRIRHLPKMKECNDRPVVVIGGGVATATFIEHARLNGLVTPILVISEESFPPYDRVLLSKNPSATGENIRLRKDDAFYEERNVKFLLNTSVVSIDTYKRTVQLSNGEPVTYSKLIIATGGNVRKLQVPGADLKNICYVRKVQEANRVANLHPGKHVVCVGASFIGMEMASSLAEKAASVTVISNTPEPLPVFGEDIGKGIRLKFEEKGVRFELAANVVALRGNEQGEVSKVILQDGKELDVDLLVCGIGVTPATEFLNGSGVKLDKRGFIEVDEKFRTNISYIFAIGDAVTAPLPLWDIDSINIQHFQTAQAHGQFLGYTIVGKPQPGPLIPYFWTLFFFAFGLKFSGCSQGFTKEYTNGDPESGTFIRYFLKKDRVVAVASGGPSQAPSQFAEIFKKGIEVTLKDLKNSKDHTWGHLLLQ
uniref:Rieske domain-containing protein n=1 Tax=Caenorhabditis tropicalis TaxID=1561998 RepID=A0A1I7V458_9PELO